MSRKFQNVPPYTGNNNPQLLRALVDSVTFITAQAQPVIQPLAPTATTAQAVAKINEIISRLQGTAG